MPSDILTLDDRLRHGSRLTTLSERPEAGRRELAALALLGVGSALLTSYVNFNLRIPGHHIVYAVFPLALGFALVPRRLAGTIMSGSAVATFAGLGLLGARVPGVGVVTSTLLAGPLLDLALRWGREGWRLYAGFVAAGALTNVVAFLVRGAAKYAGFGGLGGGRSFASWLPVAVWTYAIAGMLAGLLSALAWFHLRPRDGGAGPK